jgi:hypothetical protein
MWKGGGSERSGFLSKTAEVLLLAKRKYKYGLIFEGGLICAGN